MDSIAALFRYIGAPLYNERWSWGSETDDFLLLRVWQDETKKIEQGLSVIVLQGIYSGKDLTHRNGYKKRLKHIDQIRCGKPVYALMCRAIDPEAQPRDIQSFNKSDVFVGGKLIEEEEEIIRLELVDRITINSFKERYKES